MFYVFRIFEKYDSGTEFTKDLVRRTITEEAVRLRAEDPTRSLFKNNPETGEIEIKYDFTRNFLMRHDLLKFCSPVKRVVKEKKPVKRSPSSYVRIPKQDKKAMVEEKNARLEKAINEYRKGEKSVRQISLEYNVGRSLLRTMLDNDGKKYVGKGNSLTVFTADEEEAMIPR